MKKVSLLFGIHMHQPVDNFDEEVQKAVELCYEPFFQTMLKYPKFKFSLHCSGWLLDKIKSEYPKLFENMQILTKEGAIEWLSGGYYEPVLASIASNDRRAQIKKLSNYIKKHFKVKPRGLWLAERVWESSLVSDLYACGIKYAMVDDYHFLSNGYDADKMNGYYTTEDNARELELFPISKALRYALPFSNIDDAIKSVLVHQKEENAAAVIFDDAEKFGLWPDTNKWVYEQKWLQKFIEAVLDNENIVTQHYGEYLQKNNSLGLAYLDNCSYAEMGEWSQQTKDALAFKEAQEKVLPYIIKGGIWKNFFIKYHESNYLHKRMLYLSLQQKDFDKYSLDALYRLQTNDAFWHGVFGGFYLPSLRDNAYKYLLEIQQQRAKENTAFEVLDIDKDGYDELKVLTSNLSLMFSTKNGAQMIEFGSFDTLFNWQNTIMRRQESYHSKILHADIKENHTDKAAVTTIHNREVAVDESLKAELIYDWHAKNSFIDHFSGNEFSLENFKSLVFQEVGDFANKPFLLKNKKFVRKGGIYIAKEKYPAKLQKSYSFDVNTVHLKSKFKTQYIDKLYFAQEFNFHFAHPDKVTFNGKILQNDFSEYNTEKLIINDDFTKKTLVITANQKCNVFAFVLHTVSQSESGFEKIAQQISFIFTTSFISELQLQFSLEVRNV
ncbi:alpha-amylase/4-alpha-glucanotransferase domain-containing protein [Sulfurimonas autotrophica]|uniref:4-alpha-glucanotransferase n=1 Tax=Sulfurimonas autotrophica (strain ATCC BAA-671 / DSM 16294 / JCM 11897 / OK10) TaxID=563040 RepID=E0UP59_SULAO|nr:alpha-amylase/4-alpha-glucanotransferase domain-containing protein [Sulfurimonas autotrophica]ADN08523.1 4-alpha-glucanotransferase [Sulfurimonas autotrophica DSM 16294]